jgi:hypothetical protein
VLAEHQDWLVVTLEPELDCCDDEDEPLELEPLDVEPLEDEPLEVDESSEDEELLDVEESSDEEESSDKDELPDVEESLVVDVVEPVVVVEELSDAAFACCDALLVDVLPR